MGLIWAFDPGRATGWAVFFDGELVDCGLIKIEPHLPVDLSGPCNASVIVPKVWIEEPVFRQANNKVDVQDLMRLDRKVGRIAERCLVLGFKADTVTPSDWKGSVPKNIHNTRTLAQLTPEEMHRFKTYTKGVAAGELNNVIDGVGLGLWAAKKDGSRK